MQLKSPKTIKYPDIPFDKVAIQLSIAPIFGTVDYKIAVNVRAIPYRKLPDGTIEKNESLAETFVTGDADADAKNDPALETAMSKIGAALQEWVLRKGV